MSRKWADYAIVARKKDKQQPHIVQVKAYNDIGSLAHPQILQRSAVVSMIKGGTTFVTAYKANGAATYCRGSPIHIVRVNGVEYIRTDSNKSESDNLGELPDIS